MPKYVITLEIESESNPRKWNWYEMLEPWAEGENLLSVSIETKEEVNA